MALQPARMAVALDNALSTATHIAWSANGSSESSAVARTAVTLGAATSANPSIKSNSGSLTSAGATGAVTITHFSFYTASTAGTQLNTWVALQSPVSINSGGQITVAIGAISERLTQA